MIAQYELLIKNQFAKKFEIKANFQSIQPTSIPSDSLKNTKEVLRTTQVGFRYSDSVMNASLQNKIGKLVERFGLERWRAHTGTAYYLMLITKQGFLKRSPIH